MKKFSIGLVEQFIIIYDGKESKNYLVLQRNDSFRKKSRDIIYVLIKILLPHKLMAQCFWTELQKFKIQKMNVI